MFERTLPVCEMAALEPWKTIAMVALLPQLEGRRADLDRRAERHGSGAVTRAPSCQVPFVESRSWIIHWSPHSTSRAWWLEV